MQVQRLEQLSHGDLLPFQLVHDTFSVYAVRLFDEAQQVLLVHAGGCVDVGVHLRRRWRFGSTEVQVISAVVTVSGHERAP